MLFKRYVAVVFVVICALLSLTMSASSEYWWQNKGYNPFAPTPSTEQPPKKTLQWYVRPTMDGVPCRCVPRNQCTTIATFRYERFGKLGTLKDKLISN